MPIHEYLCRACSSRFEVYTPVTSKSSGARCACGGTGTWVPSTFSYNGLGTHTSWSLVAPVDASGNPLSQREATKAGLIDHYDSSERVKQQISESFDAPRVEAQRRQRAKRDAWRTHSAKNRIVI